MQRVTRRIFRELSRRVPVTPISWNAIGNRYQLLGPRERDILENPAQFLVRPSARPELRGEYFPAELHRHIFRKSIRLEDELKDGDVLLLPDIFRDSRLTKLPPLIAKRGIRSVAIFHDAVALRLPALHPKAATKFKKYIVSLSNFELVICISEASRQHLLELWSQLGATPVKTVVETWPVEPIAPSENVSSKKRRETVLCVGSFEARKNHLTLLRAADAGWEAGLEFDLELIGRSTGAFGSKVEAELRKLHRARRPIRWLKQVNDDVLDRAYRSCRFTIYPSLMEGFGLPIAESLIHGKPCICGGNGALGEVANGGGCLIVDQSSSDAIANGIESLLSDQQLYSRLCQEARARKFRSWPDYTANLLQHLQIQPRG
ncbi:MAG TPA: glycosyltransferase family 1 protein [Chthoniobacterales bacterium]|nr:glycosyltransferase family 1 protein [Chthoniobacterales bacterium]